MSFGLPYGIVARKSLGRFVFADTKAATFPAHFHFLKDCLQDKTGLWSSKEIWQGLPVSVVEKTDVFLVIFL